jgi:cytochrome c oxidase subunit IV
MNQNRLSFLKRNSIYLPLLIVIIDLLIHQFLANHQTAVNTSYYSVLLLTITVIYLLLALLSYRYEKLSTMLIDKAPLIAAVFILMGIWEAVTLKYDLLPLPISLTLVKYWPL